jgi:diguanylate cyclase (GGDEF)-like protein
VSTQTALAATAVLVFIMGRLSAALQIRRLHKLIRTLDGLLRVAHYIAVHDRLTGLANRFLAAQVFTLRELRGQPTLIALVDLDRFKYINDTYGHHVGDDLLRAVAERLAPAAKIHGGTAARLGGDEFLLLLPVHDGDPATPVADILNTLAQPTTLRTYDGGMTVYPVASAGIAVYDGSHGTFDTMLHHADIALYHAKQKRGTYRAYSPNMRMPRNAGRHGPRRRDEHPDNNTQTGAEAAS